MKKAVWVFALWAALVVIGISLAGSDSAGAQGGQTPMPAPSPTPRTIDSFTLSQVSTSDVLTSPSPLEINVTQPILSGPEAKKAVIDAFNSAVDDVIVQAILSFTQDLNLITPVPQAAQGSFIDIGYDVTYATPDVLSVYFGIGFYRANAAHPGSYSKVINFDLKAGTVLALADVFKPGSNYLKAVADLATADLKARNTLDFPEGAQPRLENYERWNITADGLRFVFDTYQVMPYVAGPQIVIVPYAALRDVINPQGVLAGMK
jgi:hypothetical protein